MSELGKSNKPEGVKVTVIAKRLNGESKAQIARDLDVSRPTVDRILNESEIDILASRTKTRLYEALPDSAETIARAVKKSPVHAWELLDRTGVMPKSTGEQTNVAVGVRLEGMPGLGQAEGSQPLTVNQSERPPEDGI